MKQEYDRTNEFGMVHITEAIAELPKAKGPNVVVSKMTTLKRHWQELERVGIYNNMGPMWYTDVFKKRDLFRMIPDELNKEITKDPKDKDEIPLNDLEDKIHAYARNGCKHNKNPLGLNSIDVDDGEKGEDKEGEGEAGRE